MAPLSLTGSPGDPGIVADPWYLEDDSMKLTLVRFSSYSHTVNKQKIWDKKHMSGLKEGSTYDCMNTTRAGKS